MDFFEPTFLTYLNLLFIFLVLPLWFIRMARGMFFYLYLWQLKEYHIGRFVDHFRTAKGKSLIINKLVVVKIVLLIFANPVLILLLYALEAAKAFYDIWKKRLKKPVLTKKTLLLIAVYLSMLLLFAGVLFGKLIQGTISPRVSVWVFLVFDLVTPVIVSITVLAFQPFTVLARNRIIKRAKERRKKFKNLTVIGITGSYGKTSTKEFLVHILKQKYAVLRTPEHQNSEVGISNTILRSLTDEHDVFVCEMGAYNKGGIKLLADIAKPDIAIVAGVNEQHLATFGSMENLLSAEGGEELIRALPKDGVAIVNGGSEKLKNHIPNLKGANSGVTFIVASEDVVAKDIKIEKESISFMVQRTQFHVPVYGGHNVENLLLAITAAKEIGMSFKEIAKAAETMPLGIGALYVKKGMHGVTIIDSTYSANPNGVIADLDYLSLYEGKKVMIMPCLIELGEASKRVHKRIGEKIAEVCDLAIITTKEHFQDIKEGAKQSDKVIYIEGAQEIFNKLQSLNAKEDALLLEGGKDSAVQRQLIQSLITK